MPFPLFRLAFPIVCLHVCVHPCVHPCVHGAHVPVPYKSGAPRKLYN